MRAIVVVSLITVCCAILLAGCAGSRKGKHTQIKPGMTYQQVVALMGKPDKEQDCAGPLADTPPDLILKKQAIWTEEDGTMLTCFFNAKGLVIQASKQVPTKR